MTKFARVDPATPANVQPRRGLVITSEVVDKVRILFVDQGFELITGYRAVEVLARSPCLLVGIDVDQAELKQVRRAMETGQPVSVLMRNYRKDGTMFWNAMDFEPKYDASGRVVQFSGLIQDVTAQMADLKAAHVRLLKTDQAKRDQPKRGQEDR